MSRLPLLGCALGLVISVAQPAGAQAPRQDSLALVALYTATNGPGWTRSDNWLTGPVGSWYGVSVDGAGRVTVLNLANNGLAGPLPPDIGQLASLQALRLQSNRLRGPIPTEVGALTRLAFLTLFLNDLSGPIPATVGNLTALESLGLGENQLSGVLPPELGQLQKLRQIDVNGNPIEGELPPSYGGLRSLESLVVNNTPLRGPIPLSFAALAALNTFVYDRTALCAPADPSFQAWLGGVATVTGTGVTCSVNQAPVAQNDAAVTKVDLPVRIDVLANDTDPDGDPLTVASVTAPTGGTAEVEGGGVRYTPSPGFVGEDAFTYTVVDGRGGTAQGSVAVSVRAVTQQQDSVDPLEFALGPPVPNPSRGSATIPYELAERSRVSLEVYDLLGSRVAVLAEGEQSAGRYRATLGGRLASGVYVVRLRAGAFAAARKMVVLR